MYANQMHMQQQYSFERGMEHTVITGTVEDAEDGFVDAKERLLDVRNWKRYCSTAGVEFLLRDSHGKEVHRKAHRGDHIKISVPGAAAQCMVIDAIEYDDYPDLGMEAFTLRVKPCSHDNGNHEEEEERAMEGALIIERRSRHLFATFHRRNVPAGSHDINPLGLSDAEWGSMLKKFVD
jgi:hypothetical protein